MKLLPSGLAGRTTLVLLGAVALVHVSSVLVYEAGVRTHALTTRTHDIAERIAAARQVIDRTPPTARPTIAADLSTHALRLAWPAGTTAGLGEVAAQQSSKDLVAELLALNVHAVAVVAPAEPDVSTDQVTAGLVTLVDGSHFRYVAALGVQADQHAHAALLSTSVMVGGILLVSVLLVRTIAAPLRRLAAAADRIGHDVEPTFVPAEGPTEVQHVAQAFNAMQDRLRRLISDRTQALAAVSHDLRTPITRLRLRAGFIGDKETQARVLADLDEMNAMIEATLTYLKGTRDTEEKRPTDLPSMISTLVDDLVDRGYQATWDGPAHAVLVIRPMAIKRALANLLHNAAAHGQSAHLTLEAEGPYVRIEIADSGPGIPDADLARVLEPFQRLDNSRNRETGGVGLGLTIAAQAIAGEGGKLTLRNRPAGGLEVVVLLPRQAQRHEEIVAREQTNA